MSGHPEAKVVRPGEGKRIAVAGDLYTFLAEGEDTSKSYALWEAVVPPGGGPPPHIQGREDEGFYVLEGEISFVANGKMGGEGDPVVLLHGWPQTWFEWRLVMPDLARRYKVIAPDLRGLGDSSKPDTGYDLRTLAGDIRGIVEYLGLGTIRLAGHDLGGPVAYAYAALWPEKVERLAVVEAPLLGVKVEGVENLNHMLWHFAFHQAPDVPEALVSGRERAYLTWFYKTFAYNKGAIGEEEIAEYVRCDSAPGGLRAGFAHYRAFPEDARQVAEWARTKLNLPVLALGGESSLGEITMKLYGAVAEGVRGGVIPQCGHWVAEERPDYLVEQLLAFFAA